ncbi:hypothetical protein GEMRC1_007820 [Eukaryota sp. GEM-RC1]
MAQVTDRLNPRTLDLPIHEFQLHSLWSYQIATIFSENCDVVDNAIKHSLDSNVDERPLSPSSPTSTEKNRYFIPLPRPFVCSEELQALRNFVLLLFHHSL